jgi:hypothetical protein
VVAEDATYSPGGVTVIHVPWVFAVRAIGEAYGAPVSLGGEQGVVLFSRQAVSLLQFVNFITF